MAMSSASTNLRRPRYPKLRDCGFFGEGFRQFARSLVSEGFCISLGSIVSTVSEGAVEL